ncbi:excalibur calcium-binding domain-containing protein [Streptosporangium sp. NPDC051022]|uniref:excalibur calcium-binding domain-containing protein n=1 Tax=Streptosporangium sp. NPDC051022 TaxID=3155752 RepID=UPI003421791F
MTMGMGAGPGGPGDPPVPQGPPPGRDSGRPRPPDPRTGPHGAPRGPGGAGRHDGPPGQRGPAPEPLRASRGTTITLIAALVVVVLTAGVLGTLAVLMTRNPDMPLGATPPRRLSVPIHFAPVTSTQPAPCADPDSRPDDLGQVCYTLAAGVSVDAVRRIEAIQERGGAYSVRIAFAPAFRDQINDLTQETVTQQIAIVVEDKVVAAPRVAQVITEDSLSIAGSFTKEQADAMVARLLGTGATPGTGAPTGVGTPGGVATPGGSALPGDTGTPGVVGTPGNPAGTVTPTTPQFQQTTPTFAPATNPSPNPVPTGAQAAITSSSAPTGAAEHRTDPRYPSCEAAIKAGYGGPYFRESHEEYRWYVDKDKDGVACDSDDL